MPKYNLTQEWNAPEVDHMLIATRGVEQTHREFNINQRDMVMEVRGGTYSRGGRMWTTLIIYFSFLYFSSHFLWCIDLGWSVLGVRFNSPRILIYVNTLHLFSWLTFCVTSSLLFFLYKYHVFLIFKIRSYLFQIGT